MKQLELQPQKTCLRCTHWKQRDRGAVLWEIAPPDEYECDIWQIERQWTDPNAVIEAAFLGPKKKAETIAHQCPEFSIPKEVTRNV